jgi:hypothetical protein
MSGWSRPQGVDPVASLRPDPVTYRDLVEALVGMVCQYMCAEGGYVDPYPVSSDEQAYAVLDALGLIRDGELICEVFDQEWMQRRFGD